MTIVTEKTIKIAPPYIPALHALEHARGGIDEIRDALNAVAVLRGIGRTKALWWFCNNWLPAGFLEASAGGSASCEYYSDRVVLRTGFTANSYYMLVKKVGGYDSTPTWGKPRYMGVRLKLWYNTYQNIFVVTGNAPTTGSSNTYNHLGFLIQEGHFYGTVGNGTSQSTSYIGSYDGIRDYFLELFFDPGVSKCTFYFDRTERATITTNLPSGGDSEIFFLARIENTIADNRSIEIKEVKTVQEE
jgi:hypothetical protein